MASYIKKWVSKNDVDVEICYYNNITECAEDFNNGKLDGYVSADNIVSSYTGITPVELIGKEPYYLAVAKDRDDLLEDLNETLSVIQEQKLCKYFSVAPGTGMDGKPFKDHSWISE